MAKGSFNYPHTCPKIDKAIGTCKETLEREVDSFINELCPLMPDDAREKIAVDWAKQIYDRIEDCFENVRESNQDMRNAAEDQISDTQSEIDRLTQQIDELEQQLNP